MLKAPKYSFIQFDKEIVECDCSTILEVSELSDISFYAYFQSDYHEPGNVLTLYLCDISGNIITEIYHFSASNLGLAYFNFPDFDLSKHLACGDCFRIMETNKDSTKCFSNVLLYDNKTRGLLVSYYSNVNTYFPFFDDLRLYIRLPVELVNKNPKTEIEEYIDANGFIHNPFKLRRDVYDMNVNYCPVDFHKKIQVMLMHEVIIDDISVNETGDYKIDYEELMHQGDITIYKASTEISEQDILLIRNY